MSEISDSPGRMALENMRIVHKDLMEFKKPQVPVRKRRKQIILDEDDYVEVSIDDIERLNSSPVDDMILSIDSYTYLSYFRKSAKSFKETFSHL